MPPPLKPHIYDILGYGRPNGVAILHGFPDIAHSKVDNGHKLSIFIFIKFKLFRAYPL